MNCLDALLRMTFILPFLLLWAFLQSATCNDFVISTLGILECVYDLINPFDNSH